MIHLPWATLPGVAWGVAVSIQGARAPKAAAGRRRPQGLLSAQTECPVRVPVRIQCRTSKHVHSKGRISSRHNYEHFNERNAVPHESAMHCTSGHHNCESEIPKELARTSSRLLGQTNRAPCTIGICLAIRFGARESMQGARGPKGHVALAPPGGAMSWMMSKDTPPKLLALKLRLADLYGAGSVGGELSSGGACRGKQTFTEITYATGRFRARKKKKNITAHGPRIDTVAHAAAERHYMFADVPHASRESSLSP